MQLAGDVGVSSNLLHASALTSPHVSGRYINGISVLWCYEIKGLDGAVTRGCQLKKAGITFPAPSYQTRLIRTKCRIQRLRLVNIPVTTSIPYWCGLPFIASTTTSMLYPSTIPDGTTF